jgi:GrpB-like predicted nucleotidyltransferase (UPF0157 family)
MNKYKFVKYKKNYPKLFEKEKENLKKIIPDAGIEHIGSTSIEGLGGKGIIDILISVSKKNIQNVKNKLINSKYKISLTSGDKERIFFYKDYGLFKKRRIHLALTYINSKIHKDAIKFRNSLRRNSDLRDKYSAIKAKAIFLRKKNQGYKDFKSAFIQEVLRG